MAISFQGNAYFVPVMRYETNIVVHNRSILGRWHGQIGGTGDASGGNATFALAFQGLDEMFGGHCLLDIQFQNYQSTGTNPAWITKLLQVAEPTTGSAYLPISTFINVGGELVSHPYGWTKFRIIPGGLANTLQWTAPNLATLVVNMQAAGYIYDEKLI